MLGYIRVYLLNYYIIQYYLRSLAYRGGRPLRHGLPIDPKNEKNVKQNEAVLAKAKLVFRKNSGFALDFDFPVKNHSDHPRMVVPLALPIKLICDVYLICHYMISIEFW